MPLRRVLAPLVRWSTYLRSVHLLLGAVVLLPYVLLGVAFVQLLTDPSVSLAAPLGLDGSGVARKGRRHRGTRAPSAR